MFGSSFQKNDMTMTQFCDWVLVKHRQICKNSGHYNHSACIARHKTKNVTTKLEAHDKNCEQSVALHPADTRARVCWDVDGVRPSLTITRHKTLYAQITHTQDTLRTHTKHNSYHREHGQMSRIEYRLSIDEMNHLRAIWMNSTPHITDQTNPTMIGHVIS